MKKAMHRALKLNRQMLQTDASQRKNNFSFLVFSFISYKCTSLSTTSPFRILKEFSFGSPSSSERMA